MQFECNSCELMSAPRRSSRLHVVIVLATLLSADVHATPRHLRSNAVLRWASVFTNCRLCSWLLELVPASDLSRPALKTTLPPGELTGLWSSPAATATRVLSRKGLLTRWICCWAQLTHLQVSKLTFLWNRHFALCKALDMHVCLYQLQRTHLMRLPRLR